ncbi:unnamed protein product, partial [marine sediment metagenome]
MCNLKSKSKLKKTVIYKLCQKKGEHYYTIWSGMRIRVGEVKLTSNEARRNKSVALYVEYGIEDGIFYNELAVGRTSGFKSLKIIKKMRNQVFEWKEKEIKIIKLTVSGDIVIGDGVGLSYSSRI